MTTKDQTVSDLSALTEVDVDTDVLFEILSDSRRRFVIGCLDEYDTPLALRDLADELATWERDAEITDVPAETVTAVHTALYHTHIPKMADAGIVEYNRERGVVTLAENCNGLTANVVRPSSG